MVKFVRSDDRKSGRGRDSRGRGSRGGSEGRSRGRSDSGRSGRSGRDRERREVNMTKVVCSACGDDCEVPFKPTSDKPVYCSDCFEKKEKGGSRGSSNGPSNRDLDVINEKLNKIMKALDIE